MYLWDLGGIVGGSFQWGGSLKHTWHCYSHLMTRHTGLIQSSQKSFRLPFQSHLLFSCKCTPRKRNTPSVACGSDTLSPLTRCNYSAVVRTLMINLWLLLHSSMEESQRSIKRPEAVNEPQSDNLKGQLKTFVTVLWRQCGETEQNISLTTTMCLFPSKRTLFIL